MAFSRWSQSNPQAKQVLVPDLGMRSWDEIDSTQKKNIWSHFVNSGWFAKDQDTYQAINQFNEDHKARSFCNNLLQHGGPHYIELRDIKYGVEQCCLEYAHRDFSHIFNTEAQDVFFELISYYVSILEYNSLDALRVGQFGRCFNDISSQFGLNILLEKNGFIPRQDKKIIEEIYSPVMSFLHDKKWEPVSQNFNDAHKAYLKNSGEMYSTCVTLTISALQAFLQILVEGKTGKGDIGDLIKNAQSMRLIPNDQFTRKVFKDIESILMQERKDKGDSHPKKEYANEKIARLVLNLTMVFMQHCIQS